MKYITIGIICLVCLQASLWLFNHVNGWLGLACVMLTVFATGRYIAIEITKKLK